MARYRIRQWSILDLLIKTTVTLLAIGIFIGGVLSLDRAIRIEEEYNRQRLEEELNRGRKLD